MTDKLYHECHEIISQAKMLLTDLQSWGFHTLPQSTNVTNNEAVKAVADPSAVVDLAQLEARIAGCTLCPLSAQRKNIVFGAGDHHAALVFVGEAPGREEDQQGFPFVGEAGQLLDKILYAMKMTRDEVYICNVIKCRPPSNRDPQPEEINACEPFLQQQLKLIKPRVIVALGRFAAQTLLQTKTPISRLRGSWHEYQGIPLMPTFHPAYLLRNPSGKRDVWEDMKQVLSRLSGR
ncbi:MAG: uracil-DNA glycosylase [Desulfuromonadales bacterium]|nr:uracil-DNA glycosylase [Desulfuromonadales bacterium]